jgi:hypothetical protein
VSAVVIAKVFTWAVGELLGGEVKGKDVLRQEGVWGSGCIVPHFLDLGTSWR